MPARTPTIAALVGGLTLPQALICASAGVVLWLAAALLLAWLGPMGIYSDPARMWLYAAIVPGSLPFVLLIMALASLRPGQTFPGLGIGLMAAILLDGLALAWTPGLYGGETMLAGAGAVILWGGGVLLSLSLITDAVRLKLTR